MSSVQNQNSTQVQSDAQAQTQPTDSTATTRSTGIAGATLGGKEKEAVKIVTPEAVKEISREVEISKELEQAGIKGIRETIELPPDVKKLGVRPAGPFVPISQTTVLPQVALPISDKKVIKGLHEPLVNALYWLAVWCIRKLKKAHLMLKVIHGKIVRMKTV